MSITPGRHNFIIWQGATFHQSLEVIKGGEPWNLETYSVLMEVREEPKVGEPIFVLSTGNGRIMINDSTIILFVTAEDTSKLAWESGVYDLLITQPGGDTDPLLFGGINIKGV